MDRPLLIDRDDERAALRDLAAMERKQLAILYGRRQVGKTYLLTHLWGEESRPFYFVAAAQTADLNRQDLVRELASWSGQALRVEDFPTWRTIFRELAAFAERGPMIAVLDEFQYLLGEGQATTSQLVAVWDRLPGALPLVLVLSGSAVTTMAHLTAGSEPLFGRVTWSRELLPFDYRDAARMAPWLGLRDAAYLYGIFGGTPSYLATLRDGEALVDGAVRTFVANTGAVHLQLLTLIEQITGVRQPAEYRAVLAAVAAGHTELNAIVQVTGLAEHAVRRMLEILEQQLRLVRGEQNFAATRRSPYRYRIADNAVAFWHALLLPNRSRLATAADSRAFWEAQIAPRLDAYMGLVFEQIVREAYVRYHRRWGLPTAREFGRWEGADRQRENVEIDLVGRLDDGRLLVGEIKWSSSSYGLSLHTGLQDKLRRLAFSGQGWANEAGGAVYLYVSAAGFTPEMEQFAATDPRIVLCTLADLYPDD
jgi:AAA+ ATPase superfamily predicted ATPase